MSKTEDYLPSLDLDSLVEKELKAIQAQPMSRRKVADLYELYRKLDFVERLGVLPKDKVLVEKNKVLKAIEVDIITEYKE